MEPDCAEQSGVEAQMRRKQVPPVELHLAKEMEELHWLVGFPSEKLSIQPDNGSIIPQ